jgi:hypothetical protein
MIVVLLDGQHSSDASRLRKQQPRLMVSETSRSGAAKTEEERRFDHKLLTNRKPVNFKRAKLFGVVREPFANRGFPNPSCA